MTTLTVFDDHDADKPVYTTKDSDEIGATLKPLGVQFEQWEVDKDISAETPVDEILERYNDEVVRLKVENNFATADVISLNAEHPDRTQMRKKFLAEHIHTEDEVRFFVRGEGLFYLHHSEKVFALLCQQGDLISVPAKLKHWFDMGPKPDFTCIRLFTDPEGWVAHYQDETIAEDFPKYERLMR